MKFLDSKIRYPISIWKASSLKVYQMNLEAIQGKLDAHLNECVWTLGKAMYNAHWASFIRDCHIFNFSNKVVVTGVWVGEWKDVLSWNLDPSR